MTRSTSAFDDLMTLSAKMPWPAGVALALVSYVAFHILAVRYAAPAVSPTNLADLGHVVQRQLVGTLALFLQYIVPVGFLMGAAVSAWRRAHSIKLFGRASVGGAAAIDAMSWPEFELLVGQAFRQQGFTVSDNIVAGPDGGVDLVLQKGSERFLVQCKQWRSKTVGVAIVRELYGVITARSAAGGMVVTSGRFTADAQAFAARCSIDLIDGARLNQMIGAVTTGAKEIPAQQRAPAAVRVPTIAPISALACPRCGGTMVRRTARRGGNAGGEFWGCQGFPQCRGTMQM